MYFSKPRAIHYMIRQIFRDCLSNALDECGQHYQVPVTAAVTVLKNGGDGGGFPSHEMRVEHKRFFFDMGTNSRGTFLRVSGMPLRLIERKQIHNIDPSTSYKFSCIECPKCL
jgi:hypothetical protein